MPCSSAGARCSGSSRTASSPAWIFGCSVLTRPSRISGKPVRSSIGRTSMPGLAQLAGRAAGRDDLDAQLGEAAGEVDDAGLVGDREQRAPDPDLPGRGDRLRSAVGASTSVMRCRGSYGSDRRAARVGRVEADRAAGDQPDRLGQQLVLDRHAAARTRRRRARVRQLERPEGDRAGVDALVDEVHGDAEDLDPVVDRLLDRAEAREGRQQRRMDVDDRGPGSAR